MIYFLNGTQKKRLTKEGKVFQTMVGDYLLKIYLTRFLLKKISLINNCRQIDYVKKINKNKTSQLVDIFHGARI
jgi:hypothetical protein